MKALLYISLAFSVIFLTGCDKWENPYDSQDYNPPSIPTNVVVLNGDNRVDISWNRNNERDLEGYNVYYSTSYNGKYTLIGNTQNNYFVDNEAVNGNKYYYAVTSYDVNGNESELSKDNVYAVPRPEGFNQTVFDYKQFPSKAGYAFSKYQAVAYDSQDADFYFENSNGTFYLNVWKDSDIRDMGMTQDIYDIQYAPSTGWSSTKDVIVKEGHTYVIWTWNNHFAKIRVNYITNERIVFDWAYQLVEGEKMLKNVKSNTVRLAIDKQKD